jgi:hypothetical protein
MREFGYTKRPPFQNSRYPRNMAMVIKGFTGVECIAKKLKNTKTHMP